jgi:NADH:ubiquinone reductase (non-electrogenic)
MGKATDVDWNKKSITIRDEKDAKVQIAYDKLVLAIGGNGILILARNATFGIPGVKEYVLFCKSIGDAQKIRERILTCFERASYPGTSDMDKSKLLTFVCVGAGPTGVEFAAELHDFLQGDLIKYFPDLVKRYVRVVMIQGDRHVLNTFDQAISNYTEDRFKRANIRVITSAFVVSVDQHKITYKVKEDEEEKFQETYYGCCVWSTGIEMHTLTTSLMSKQQLKTKALAVDRHLKVMGTDDVYAIGDCACIVGDDGKIAGLPATAQVASQQGNYLAKILNQVGKHDPSEWKSVEPKLNSFVYRHFGNFAYVGKQSAVMDFGSGRNVGGFGGWFLWRSAYLSKQVSLRTRVLLAWDWTKTILFGRDISRIQ